MASKREQTSEAGRKILIVCVGGQDPLNPESGKIGPILSFFDYLQKYEGLAKYRPERIYLLPTMDKPGASRPTQTKGEQTRDALKQRGWNEVYVKPLDVVDPSNYTQLIPVMLGALESIRRENDTEEQPAEYLICVSPGTGQMEAVWLSFAKSGITNATLLQVKAPWDEPDESKRVREVEFEPLFESDFIKIAEGLFRDYLFHRAEKIFEDLALRTPNDDRMEAAEVFTELAAAYADWEGFKYQDARARLERSLKGISLRKHKFAELLTIAEKQFETATWLTQKDVPTTAVDVFHCARRRVKVRDYMKAMWLFWATYEILVVRLAEETLRTECRLSASFNFPEKFREFGQIKRGTPEVRALEKKIGNADYWPEFFDRGGAEWILNYISHPAWGTISAPNSGLDWLKVKRNATVHDVTPPDLPDCQRAESTMRNLLEQIFNCKDLIDQYPFSPESIRQVRDLLRVLL